MGYHSSSRAKEPRMADTIIRLPFVTRRAAIAGGVVALGGGMGARSQDAPATAAPAQNQACLIYPRATEGPYYFDPQLQRADVTEDRPGSPLRLIIGVQGADCRPIEGARVDIWHCDAQGTYSGYNAAEQADARGETFLRGWQPTDAAGEVEFRTIYPGWYPGRTPHIHLKVILEGNDVMTSQLYFPEEVNDAIYRLDDYARPGARDTRNANDGIARQQGEAAFGAVSEEAGGHLVRLLVGVDPAARSSGFGGRGPARPRP
jgi:protocatechuate 3,4-dioxygenase beta subunit